MVTDEDDEDPEHPAPEPHLRIQIPMDTDEDHEDPEHPSSDPHLRIQIPMGTDGDHENSEHKMGGSFSIEKVLKCTGGFEKGKGKKCNGGMKSEFTLGASADDIANEVANQVFDETNNFMPSKESFFPDDGAMEEMMLFDDVEYLEGIEEGVSKSVEFGGFIEAEWNCKVIFKKKCGKFTKKSQCSFKGVGGLTGQEEQ
jgi:hypothetical protein